MARRITKYLQFSQKTKKEIMERDGRCVFCQMRYHMESSSSWAYQIMDIMHVVPKSQLGMGVKENGVLGCRYHHNLLDNGNKGLRTEMKQILMDCLTRLYPGWTEDSVTYHKGL